MIYLFAGDDFKKRILNYEKFISSLGSDMEIYSIGKNDFDKMQVESLYSGAGLFFTKSLIIFTNIFEREDIQDFILEKLELMGQSKNIFVFVEGKLNKPILDAFRKARAELNIFEAPKEKQQKFNNFLLVDAFSMKDKLHLWIYFRQAMEAGASMEELIGILFWKAKDMISKKDFRKFSEDELKNFAGKLSYLLPEARKKGIDDETAFEQFLLEAL